MFHSLPISILSHLLHGLPTIYFLWYNKKSISFQLPSLPYEYNALEPYIDEATMRIHHEKHHAGYVMKLNTALEGPTDRSEKSIEDLLKGINSIPEDIRQAVINNGGGHANHSLFWQIMSPDGGGEPTGELAKALGDYANFKEEFTNVATTRFGSGWAWLVVKENKTVAIYSTANQDSPLMQWVNHETADTPILGLDVWEHAYYLKYQNKRPDYISAFFNIIDWKKVEELYQSAVS